MEMLLVKSPSVAGSNVTVIVHVAPAARLEPHVLVWEKGSATAIPIMRSSAEPVLLNVMTCPELVMPTTWLPNEMLGIDKVGVGDPLTDKLALGDPPQAVKTTTLQIASEKYLFMAAGRKTAPIRTTKGR
jgi:hypothetical protein